MLDPNDTRHMTHILRMLNLIPTSSTHFDDLTEKPGLFIGERTMCRVRRLVF